MADDTYKIDIDGNWTLVDLYEFPHTYSQVFALTFSLYNWADIDDEKRKMTFASHPWRGGYSAVNFYQYLQQNIPRQSRLKLISLKYGSPGWIELGTDLGMGLGVTLLIRNFIATFVRSASQLNSLYHEIYKGLQDRKLLRLEVKRAQLGLQKEEMKFVETSAKQLAEMMGFKNLQQINALTGNPLATLKILLSFYRRVKKLAEYEKNGKANL